MTQKNFPDRKLSITKFQDIKNQLIDATKVTDFQEIVLRECDLNNEELITQLAKIIKQNQQLTTINLDSCKLTDKNLAIISDNLNHNLTLSIKNNSVGVTWKGIVKLGFKHRYEDLRVMLDKPYQKALYFAARNILVVASAIGGVIFLTCTSNGQYLLNYIKDLTCKLKGYFTKNIATNNDIAISLPNNNNLILANDKIIPSSIPSYYISYSTGHAHDLLVIAAAANNNTKSIT